MKGLRKVIWAEGMFLGQQHFQLWDRYYEHYQSMQSRSISPIAWGVLNVEIDKEALENAQFRVNNISAIFPDGRLIGYDIGEDKPLSLSLEGGYSEKVDIYLCLPVNRSATGINGYRETGQLCAWQADYLRVSDENDPNRQREVMLGAPNLMLLTGGDSRENFSTLKIAEVVNDGEGHFSLVESYIPTISRINASPRLMALMQSLIELFSAKVRVLNERRKQLSAQIATFGHSDISNFLILQALSGAIPILQHLRENSDLHPEQLYQLLSRLIGNLCPFSFDIDVHSIPRYRHHDLTKVFDGLERQLRALVDVAMPTKINSLKLVKEADLLWSVDSIESTQLAQNDFYLAVLSPVDDPMWVKHFERIVKIGARADIEVIIASALQGVRLVHTQRPPSNLPVKSGYEYFRIEPKGQFWDRIEKDRTMGLYVPKVFIKAKMELVLVPKE